MHPKLIDIITKDTIILLRLDEAAVFNLKVDTGLTYLEKRFEHDPNIGRLLSTHANFWHWWRELWAHRDQELIKHCERKPWGIAFHHRMKEVKTDAGPFRPTQLIPILECNLWNFYGHYHNPDRIPFYPNYVLIKSCIGDGSGLTLNPSPKERDLKDI